MPSDTKLETAGRKLAEPAARLQYSAHSKCTKRTSLAFLFARTLAAAFILVFLVGCFYDEIFWIENDTGLMFLTLKPKDDNDEGQWIVATANVATGEVSQVNLPNTTFKVSHIAPSPDAEFLCLVPQDNESKDLHILRKTEAGYAPKAVFVNASMNFSANPWSSRERLFVCSTPPSMVSSDAPAQLSADQLAADGSTLVIYNADANTSSPLRTPPGFATHPVWSNDARRIAFYFRQTERSDTFDLCVADLSTGKIETIAQSLQGSASSDEFPYMSCAWSPSDTRIAVPEGNAFIIVDLDARRPHRVPIEPDDPCIDPAPMRVFFPRFSPDGKYLAFCGTQKDEHTYGRMESDIWLAATDEQRAKRLTKLPGDEYAPAWNARSDRIAFLYGSENASLIPATVDLDSTIKWYPLGGFQRLALVKDYLVLFDRYYDVMREWKLKTDDALDTAMSLFQKVSYNERKGGETKKLYDEVFKALSEKVKQR